MKMRNITLLLHCTAFIYIIHGKQQTYLSKSGLKDWIDADTPASAYKTITSRGETWDLVMSDEFNLPGRDFRAGNDHLWTALDIPDGVNAALEYYSPNMTTTVFDNTNKIGYFQIKVIHETVNITVYNQFKHPPAWQNLSMAYRSGMIQTWNKFCFQGGRLEVRAILPGITSVASGNPDAGGQKSNPIKDTAYYPTWPGIWMMGNLGRALFTGSTSRVWPWTYNECRPEFKTQQKFSACEGNPGFGLNPYQGRGAPEIDLFEGGGSGISSSVQIGPGMPAIYRRMDPKVGQTIDGKTDGFYCSYSGDCVTPGANYAGVPTAVYKSQRPTWNSWYQGLRYSANKYCTDGKDIQTYDTVMQSLQSGITENNCTAATCPASRDVYGDFSFVDSNLPNASTTERWGIKSTTSCFAIENAYNGAYLCDPDNTDQRCSEPRNSSTPPSNEMKPFNYQMDAISANWDVHFGAYTDWTIYQLEWVTGSDGYIRWMLFDSVIFEIPAKSIEVVPQNGDTYNPRKLMIEEPMYLIMNVALSSSWSATPRDMTGKVTNCIDIPADDTKTKAICDAYPLYLKVDYIRLYQDQSSKSRMAIGCDPATHPTAKYIENFITDYTDSLNPHVPVSGLARCYKDEDCSSSAVSTGTCYKGRCKCSYPNAWIGPRCARPAATEFSGANSVGPPFILIFVLVAVTLLLAIWTTVRMQLHIKSFRDLFRTFRRGNGKKQHEEITEVEEVPYGEQYTGKEMDKHLRDEEGAVDTPSSNPTHTSSAGPVSDNPTPMENQTDSTIESTTRRGRQRYSSVDYGPRRSSPLSRHSRNSLPSAYPIPNVANPSYPPSLPTENGRMPPFSS